MQLPAYIWTEEYQVELMSRHFFAFDKLREKGFFIGEFIWNFADFKTAQSKLRNLKGKLKNRKRPFAAYTRVGGNKKGIFTRNREPKASAHHLRKRYWALAKQLYDATPPSDLYNYVAPTLPEHDEL